MSPDRAERRPLPRDGAHSQHNGNVRIQRPAGIGTRAAALAAAARGWSVFPLRRDGDVDPDGKPAAKRPAVDKWEQRATSDPDLIRRYWPGPRSNIGIACGPSGLVVVDLDMPKPGTVLPPEWAAISGIRSGADVLAVLADRAGQRWPCTYSTRSASGGMHLYFTAIDGRAIRNNGKQGSRRKIGPLVDHRGGGGYIVAAGSVVDGRPYACIDDSAPVPLPHWLAELADPPPLPAAPRGITSGPRQPAGSRYAEAALRGELEALLATTEGSRNVALNDAAFALGQLCGSGALATDRTAELLQAAGERIGLPAFETTCTIRSGMTAGAACPRASAA